MADLDDSVDKLTLYAVPFLDKNGKPALDTELYTNSTVYVVARNVHEAFGLASSCIEGYAEVCPIESLCATHKIHISRHGEYDLEKKENLETAVKNLFATKPIDNWR